MKDDLPASQEPKPQFVDDIKFLESLSKVFAVAVGVMYLLGFLVVSTYLSRYGVSSFDVLQLQYLIAGVWAFGPPVLLTSALEIQGRFDRRAAPEVVGKFNWRRLLISNLFSGLPWGVLMGLLVTIPNVSDNLTWAVGIRLFLFYIGMWYVALLLWRSRQVPIEKEKWWLNRSHAAPLYASALFILVLSYAVWFSARLYPLIPFSLGGGKPLTVVFFEGEKKMPDEIRKADPSAKRSVPYKLLLATDKYFVVVSPSDKERALQISRDSVAGIVVLSAN